MDHIFGDRFVKARSSGKAAAWLQLQADLSRASSRLVPSVIPMKDYIAIMMQIEDFIKDAGGRSGRSPQEIMRDFLLTNTIPEAEPDPDEASMLGDSVVLFQDPKEDAQPSTLAEESA